MSSSDLYRVYRTKTAHYAEMRNGWGTAPVVWSYLVVRFLGRARHDYLRENDQELWSLCRAERVPRELRLVHAFCCDQAICPLDRLADLATACEEVYRLTSAGPGVNHWATIANFLRGHCRKPKQLGLGLSCTSVSDPWIGWKPQRTQAPWDIFEYVDRKRDAA